MLDSTSRLKKLLNLGTSYCKQGGDLCFIWKNKETNKIHRDDGPAVEWKSGLVEFFIDGMRHREDGPAVVGTNREEYWLNNQKMSKSEHSMKIWLKTKGY